MAPAAATRALTSLPPPLLIRLGHPRQRWRYWHRVGRRLRLLPLRVNRQRLLHLRIAHHRWKRRRRCLLEWLGLHLLKLLTLPTRLKIPLVSGETGAVDYSVVGGFSS